MVSMQRFHAGQRVIAALLLASLLCLALASSAFAQTDEEGCGCHTAEKSTWEMSTHGQIKANGEPVAACETCHGVYTRGHPEQDMLPLDTDSSVCADCHETTVHEWEGTIHATAGVQCIGCHVAHSQDLRLGNQAQCESCHREAVQDPLHTAHWLGDVTCTNCHMAGESAMGGQLASADFNIALVQAPSHDFVTVSARNCLDCHAKEVQTDVGAGPSDFIQRLDVISAAAEAPTLRADLAAAQQTTRTTALFVPMSLGFGVSIGGVLGIAFVLVAASWGRRKGGK